MIILLLLVIGVMAFCLIRHRLLSSLSMHSAERHDPATFQCLCGDMYTARQTNETDNGNEFRHVQVSQDYAAIDVEAASPTLDNQLVLAAVLQQYDVYDV